MFALDVASGPTSRSSSIATGCSGIRTMTVPLVLPRSQASEGAWCTTRLKPPGQNARTSSRASDVTRAGKSVDRVPRPDQDGDRHVPATALGRKQSRDRLRTERVRSRGRRECQSESR